MGHGLEGLMDAGLSQLVMHGPRRAQAVPRVPDDILKGLPRLIGSNEVGDDRLAPMRPRPARARRM